MVEGGNYDVDVILNNAVGAVLYSGQKKQYDRFDFTVQQDGEHILCFSNEFSTFTHKFVYFEFSKDNTEENEIITGSPMTQVCMI